MRDKEIAQIATLKDSDRSLSPTQIDVMAALLSGKTIKSAADQAGVDRSTIHRWMREDWDFQAARNRGVQAIEAATITGLQALAQSAFSNGAKVNRRGRFSGCDERSQGSWAFVGKKGWLCRT